MGEILRPILKQDGFGQREMEQLLRREGISRDANLDYSCGVYDEDENLIATGSCFGSTIRCLAVDSRYRGQGLLVQVVSHLLQVQASRGNLHVFLYTKCGNAPFFTGLGFFEIARVPDQMVFMENRRDGFRNYCMGLEKRAGARIAAVVMNANPFTLGHRHLVEQASRENDAVHLFVLRQEAGPIPYAIRRKLVEEGVADLANVAVQDTGPYLISAATFPSYFLKDQDAVIDAHAAMDLAVFAKIAAHLGIQRRYAGQEPTSRVTGRYNRIMAARLPELGIECRVIPRLEAGGAVISASTVRRAIQEGDMDTLQAMVPPSTWRYFDSPESAAVREAICREKDVVHY